MQTEPEHIDNADDLLASFKVHRYSRRLWAALLAEFLGLCIFQIYGGAIRQRLTVCWETLWPGLRTQAGFSCTSNHTKACTAGSANDDVAALSNGFTLAVIGKCIAQTARLQSFVRLNLHPYTLTEDLWC